MARLYSNENFPFGVVKALREFGYDVLTSHEAKQANQSIPDENVLAFASDQKRIVLTINRRDFIALHKKTHEHAGIIVCTQDVDFAGQANRIHQALLKQPKMAGELIRISRPPKK